MRAAQIRECLMDWGYDCARAGMDRYAARTLPRIAKRLHRLYERACDDPELDMDRYYRATERWQARADAICKAEGVEIEHQTDPRGWPIILRRKADGESLGVDMEWRVPPFMVGEGRDIYEDFQKVSPPPSREEVRRG